VRPLKALRTLILLIGFGVFAPGCGKAHWSIDRIRASSPLHGLTVGIHGQKSLLQEAVRRDLPNGTPIDVVRRYIQQNFVDDGRLITEDSTNRKTNDRYPPRIRLRLIEYGDRFAGSGKTDLNLFFDDDGRLLDGVNDESSQDYL
jgi:hypothetical protein